MVSCMRKTPWLHLGPLCWGLTARHKPEGSSSAVRNHAPSWSREALCRPVCVLADTVSCRQTASCGGAPSCRERGAERQRRGPGSVWLGRQPCRTHTHTPPPEHLSPFRACSFMLYSAADKAMQERPVEEIRGVGSWRGSRSGPDSLPMCWVRCGRAQARPQAAEERRG